MYHIYYFFPVTNGIKQGGISLPMLFNVHMASKLNQPGIGEDTAGHLINYLCCADGSCLVSVSSAGMQIF